MHAFVCVHRYLDDVSLHHLINALCSLSLEAMEMAYGNNKVDFFSFYHALNQVAILEMQLFCELFFTRQGPLSHEVQE